MISDVCIEEPASIPRHQATFAALAELALLPKRQPNCFPTK